MPRPLLIRSEIHPYHISSRHHEKEFFPLPISKVWEIMLEELKNASKQYDLAVHAFVLMGNHFHLLCHTPRGNLDEAMMNFLRATAQRMKTKWDAPYKWSMIDSQTHYYQVYRYIFQNPVRVGLCNRVEDYPYSTLNDVPITLHSFIPMSFAGKEGELIWLNEKYEKDDEVLIKLGLRKHQFDVSQRKLKAFNKLSVPNKPLHD